MSGRGSHSGSNCFIPKLAVTAQSLVPFSAPSLRDWRLNTMLQFIIFQLHSLSPVNKLLNTCETAFPSVRCCHSISVVSNVQHGYYSSLLDWFGRLVVSPHSHELSPVASAWLEEGRTLLPQIFCVSTDSSPADWGVAPGWCHCRASVQWGQRLLCLLQSALCLGGRSAGGQSLAHQPDPSHGGPSSGFSS